MSDADIFEFVNEISGYIDNLNAINTKVDFTEEYTRGYNDACVAIKNTVKTLGHKLVKENGNGC